MRTLRWLVVSSLLSAALPPVPAQAQTVGVVAGRSESRLVGERQPDSEARSNPLLGAWVDVETPTPLFHLLAEATWVRRGGGFPTAPGTIGGTDVQGDYLSALLAPNLRAGVGALSVFIYGGPALDLHLRTRTGVDVATAFRDPSPQGFSVVGGVGAALALGTWELRGEARRVVGLSSAYTFEGRPFHHRATELLVRLGRAPR